MHGVDVGDGGGVRSSATQYDDNGWYATTDPAWGDSPYLSVGLDALSAIEAITNASAPFTVAELAELNVSLAAALTVDDLITARPPATFVPVDMTMISVECDLTLSVDPAVVPDDRLVDSKMAGFGVDDWVAVDGAPVSVTGLVLTVGVQTGVGTLPVPLETFPEPRNVDVEAYTRFLPLDAYLTPFNDEWVPYSKYLPEVPFEGYTVTTLAALGTVADVMAYTVEDLIPGGRLVVNPTARERILSSPGVAPRLLPKYAYYRKGGYVRNDALQLSRGAHMWTDTINWNVDELTIIVVAVLHEPDSDWYSIMETEGPNVGGLDPFFGLRYHRSGVAALWADSMLASVEIDVGVTRPAQPVVLGVNIDMVENTISMLAVDRAIKRITNTLPQRYDNRSRLWVGRSPHGANATANMELLELAVFDRTMSNGEVYQTLAKYDRIYGVTTS